MTDRVEKMYAYLAIDPANDIEGVVAAPIPGTGKALTMPLVGADMERMTSYWPIVEQLANLYGAEIKLVEFAVRTDIDTILPKRTVRRERS